MATREVRGGRVRPTSVPIAPEQRCVCPRPLSSGRLYYRRPACVRCGKLMVQVAERRLLEELEASQLERERIQAAKQSAEAA